MAAIILTNALAISAHDEIQQQLAVLKLQSTHIFDKSANSKMLSITFVLATTKRHYKVVKYMWQLRLLADWNDCLLNCCAFAHSFPCTY